MEQRKEKGTMDIPELQDQIRALIVSQLRLKIQPEEIGVDDPFFSTLGLDSIDGLELMAALEKTFNVSLEEEPNIKDILTSVSSIASYIARKGEQ